MSAGRPHHAVLPKHRDRYSDGAWQVPRGGYVETRNITRLEYGLPASIRTRDLTHAQRPAARIGAGYASDKHTTAHFRGADFGGYQKSGIGREESLGEMLRYTHSKNSHLQLG